MNLSDVVSDVNGSSTTGDLEPMVNFNSRGVVKCTAGAPSGAVMES